MLPRFSYIQAKSLEDAIHLLSEDGARLHAGGTDLLGCLREDIFDAKTVVSISRLAPLKGIAELPAGGLRIGALTTVAEIARNPVIRAKYGVLSQAAGEVASPQLRNQGTMGGNLCQKPRCWYYRGEFNCLRKGGDRCYAVEGENQYHCIFGGDGCYMVHPSDIAPALVALDAAVQIAGPKGKRSTAIEDFHMPSSRGYTRETTLEPGEIVTDILLPAPKEGLKSSYRKVRARRAWDFALAGIALATVFKGDQVTDCRISLSGAAPVPWRSKEAEAVLTGNRLDSGIIKKAAQAALSAAEPMTQNGYKIPLFKGLMEEVFSTIPEL
jgi:xanthine dehydrogenase YagS FAD-binding subunit